MSNDLIGIGMSSAALNLPLNDMIIITEIVMKKSFDKNCITSLSSRITIITIIDKKIINNIRS